VAEADYLILETTYGDRVHESSKDSLFGSSISFWKQPRGGTVVIPSFAVAGPGLI
jgi:metallo-beta-lactamase family protein